MTAFILRTMGVAFTLAGVTFSSVSQAESREDPPIRYEFEDDALLGDGIYGHVPIITVNPKPQRVQLLRPRVTFLLEMLKSVEGI